MTSTRGSITAEVSELRTEASTAPANVSFNGVGPERPIDPKIQTATAVNAHPIKATAMYSTGVSRPATAMDSTIAGQTERGADEKAEHGAGHAQTDGFGRDVVSRRIGKGTHHIVHRHHARAIQHRQCRSHGDGGEQHGNGQRETHTRDAQSTIVRYIGFRAWTARHPASAG